MQHTISIHSITQRVNVRAVKPGGVEQIKQAITRAGGYLPEKPLLVTPDGNGGYILVDGNHRLEAATALELTDLPAFVDVTLTDEVTRLTRARAANAASETLIPTTFVDDAELVWRLGEQHTQEQIAGVMGWERGKVGKYAMLQKIDPRVWAVVVPTFENIGTGDDSSNGTVNVPNGTFTEGLLRSILDLTPDQQLELVTALADGRIQKGGFKSQAESYKARNEAAAYVRSTLADVDAAFVDRAVAEVDKGAYDKDWRDPQRPRLTRLLAAIREEWEQKIGIQLICGDFYDEVLHITDSSIDLILTDPPYNIANEREFIFTGRKNVSQNFGEWDKHEESDFVARFNVWAAQWARLLRDGGSGYVFTSDAYISHLRESLARAGLHFRATIVWHKTNPGTQVVKTNFRSSVEYILFFTKGENGHTFNWQGENEMHNFYEAPICGGNERLHDAKGDTLHPTQKPERVIHHLLNISSNRGDVVFDGFMGVGTTAAVAKANGRKFIGIEQAQAFFDAAKRRLQ